MVQWGVPDREVTIAILMLGKGRVSNYYKKILAGLVGSWGWPRAKSGQKRVKSRPIKKNMNIF